MARHRKQDEPEKTDRGIGDNGIDPALARGYVDKIERLIDDIGTEKARYMRACKGIRDTIATEYENAVASGIPRKELRAVVRARAFERKADALRAELEGDEADVYDQIRTALGDYADTPLGAAAIERAESPEYRV